MSCFDTIDHTKSSEDCTCGFPVYAYSGKNRHSNTCDYVVTERIRMFFRELIGVDNYIKQIVLLNKDAHLLNFLSDDLRRRIDKAGYSIPDAESIASSKSYLGFTGGKSADDDFPEEICCCSSLYAHFDEIICQEYDGFSIGIEFAFVVKRIKLELDEAIYNYQKITVKKGGQIYYDS